jgi:phosphoribosyl 1,2-cyclic phosphodiesterase
LRVVSLASGSSGNSYLVRTEAGAFLLDVGVPTRRIERSLTELGLTTADLVGVLVTHEHHDHIAGLASFARKHRLPIYGNEATLAAAGVLGLECVPVAAGRPFGLAAAQIVPFALPHDSTAMMSYRVEWASRTMCFLTDLGHCPDEALEHARGVDLLVLEANHDVARLTAGPYPYHLQRRILGPRGHLSNQQAADCALACVSGRPQTIWLAHLSQTNNDPVIALGVVEAALTREGIRTCEVKVAARDRRSLIWDAVPAFVQLRLF